MYAAPMTISAADIKAEKSYKQTVAPYAVCLLVCMLVLHHIAEYEFSSVLTLSVFFQCLSFVMVGTQIQKSQSVGGVSAKTMMMYALMFCFRLSSTCFLDGYLPLDKSGDMTYQLADICSLLMVLKVLHCCYFSHKRSYSAEEDSLDIKGLILGCGLLAILIHPDLNDWATFDIAWTMSLYLDTVAMLPQLWVVSKAGRIPAYTAHYIFTTTVSRGFSAWFWYYGAENIARASETGFSWGAVAIVVAHLIQFLLLADFAVYYVKAFVTGKLSGSPGSEVSVYDI